ncbi:hypothetical protein E4U41_006830 [Claviceps citrina]|nr:hypothetical protein E4U41_006830 [Claviceps citrina]
MSRLTAIPYNRVQTTRNILFATRGGKIHSFNLSDSKHLSTWQHPDVEKFAITPTTQKDPAPHDENQAAASAASDAAAPAAEASEPPAKRQKTAQGKEEPEAASDSALHQHKTAEASAGSGCTNQGKRRGKKQSKGPSHGDNSRMGKVVDRPVITLMACTNDGSHLVAVSGHDKAVWVFEHDGHGALTQLSQRVMPKRPSSITLGFGPQIIVADKFGDVYALPLLTTPLSPSVAALAPRTPSSLVVVPKLAEPAANTLTVHSKRNRAALEHQRKQMESEKANAGAKPKSEDTPSFELTLLLGHVSMLTSLVVAEAQGKRYILTADRDEHIRVSRYIPQAHIIETFCLGHREFVSEILVPPSHGDVLISGGGDEDILLWDWRAGAILSRTNLLLLAREIAPQTSKIAVSGLTSFLYPSESGGPLTYVLAICEDLKAIFAWELTDEKQLKNPSIIQLPCNPLHITIASPSKDSPPKLIVAMDPGQDTQTKSLHEYTLTLSEGRLSSDVELPLHGQTADDAEMQVSEKDIRSMFYVVENLRKQQGGEDGEGGEEDGSTAIGNNDSELLASPAAAIHE